MLRSAALTLALALQCVNGLPSNMGFVLSHDAELSTRGNDLEVSSNIMSLQRTKGALPPSSRALLASRAKTGREKLIPVGEGVGYDIVVDLASTSFDLIFDTGSSDLWVASSKFQCLQPNNESEFVEAPQSACAFGKLFSGTYDDGTIANENFNISYGDGEFVTGTVGKEDITTAGITVKAQEIAIGTEAYWVGDNTSSGIIGFAYPALTSAFEGTDPSTDTLADEVPYNPFAFNAINESKIAPLFSLAIERGANGGGGQVALGGLPNITFEHNFASTPLEAVALTPVSNGTSNFTYYTITPQGYSLSIEADTYNGPEKIDISPSTDFAAIVDSGTTLLYYPTEIAEQVNSLFDPPAVYIESEGVFEAECDAVPPTFGIKIGGQTFYINGADLLLTGELGEDPETGLCVTGVQPSPEEPYILGDVFLKNVVAVYDIGASEMRFAAHENY